MFAKSNFNKVKYFLSALTLFSYGTYAAINQKIDSQFVSVKFPLTRPDFQGIIGKQLDPQTGIIKLISKSPEIKSGEDLVRMEKAEAAAGFLKHGALSGALRDKFYSLKDSDEVNVRVQMRYPQPPIALDPETHTLAEVKANAKAIAALNPVGSRSAILAENSGLKNVRLLDKGSFDCRINKKQLNFLRKNDLIASVEFIPNLELATVRPNQPLPPFFSLTTSAYNPLSSMPSYSMGQGVNAATFETGIGNSTTGNDGGFYPYGNLIQCLHIVQSSGINVRIPPWESYDFGLYKHSHQTFKCLQQTAPYANLYHKNMQFSNPYYSDPDNTAFLIDSSIQTASMSYGRALWDNDTVGNPHACKNKKYPTVFPSENATGSEMIRLDEAAYVYPYPIFSNPTANWGSDYEVNWQCYNHFSVGNVRHTSLYHYEIPTDQDLVVCENRSSCTQTRNPPPLWGGSSLRAPLADPTGYQIYPGSSGDREMPYLVAPGTSPVSGVSMVDQIGCLEGPLFCGTSYSAPILNGIVACVISADSRMVNRPHVVRAVLLATAENVDGLEWNTNVDGKDGAGVVSGSSAVAFAVNHSVAYPYGSAVVNGISSGTVGNTMANGTTGTFNILVPTIKPPGKHLRVVMLWTSNPVRSPAGNWLSDFDLSVSSDNNNWYSSRSYNSSIEIVDIPASQLTSGQIYQAIVSLYANRIPTSGISSGYLKYALAWTWVKDHAD